MPKKAVVYYVRMARSWAAFGMAETLQKRGVPTEVKIGDHEVVEFIIDTHISKMGWREALTYMNEGA
jgi:hypothetical protein